MLSKVKNIVYGLFRFLLGRVFFSRKLKEIPELAPQTHVVNNNTIEELPELFDKKFGCLNGSTILSNEEYQHTKEWSLEIGLFAFQVQKHGWA